MRNKFMIAGFLFALIGATLPQALLAADAAAPKAVTAEDLAKTPPSATLDIAPERYPGHRYQRDRSHSRRPER